MERATLGGQLMIIVKLYFAIAAVMAFLKLPFIWFNPEIYSGYGLTDYLGVVRGGLSMDFSVAAYMVSVPTLLCCVLQWVRRGDILNRLFLVWIGIVSFIISAVFCVDTILYGYWGFKLDTTPLFYFSSSPRLALASGSPWEIAGGIAGTVGLGAAVFFWLRFAMGKVVAPAAGLGRGRRWVRTAVFVVLAALLFIPIRGGFTVATMNLSSAYFSNDNRLNHAAVNPVFSLLSSLSHSDDIGSQFRFYDEEEVACALAELNRREVADSCQTRETEARLKTPRPDIYLIILESFSTHLFPSAGGENIARGLDSIASEGIFFNNLYASSFRTDRALPAILSGYPGQPTTSVMKNVSKAQSLPSIAGELKKNGYQTEYYYGGDANFTNMRAYLSSTGFNKIVSDKDFPLGERLSKWGAPDGALFVKVMEELSPYEGDAPCFRVIQTSSSHEPFDVPRSPRSAGEPKEVTAFEYTDSCVTSFINRLHSDETAWENSLIAIVPDHYGAYPKNLENGEARHSIPLILTGGALEGKGKIGDSGSQTDIAATLLTLLGLDSSGFPFSHDLFGKERRHYAFYSSKSEIGLTTDSSAVVWNIESGRTDYARGDTTGLLRFAKSYVQNLYRDLDRR